MPAKVQELQNPHEGFQRWESQVAEFLVVSEL